MGQKLKWPKKKAKNDSTRTLELFAKNRWEKRHQVFEK